MPAYVALLRGIAPSGRNMQNDALRGVHERLGLAAVGSVLASGNITFRSAEADVAALETSIERALTQELGLRSAVVVRSHQELQALVDLDPFPGMQHGRSTYLTATFLKDAPTAGEASAEGAGGHTWAARYEPGARAVLAVTDNSNGPEVSDFMGWLERSYGRGLTTRSWLTVHRVVRALDATAKARAGKSMA